MKLFITLIIVAGPESPQERAALSISVSGMLRTGQGKVYGMKVVVASKNPVKVAAARRAFEAGFPSAAVEVEPVSADSGVDDQPFTDEDTRHGAINRAHNAREVVPEADFWVGLEGGVDDEDLERGHAAAIGPAQVVLREHIDDGAAGDQLDVQRQ